MRLQRNRLRLTKQLHYSYEDAGKISVSKEKFNMSKFTKTLTAGTLALAVSGFRFDGGYSLRRELHYIQGHQCNNCSTELW